jgi:hypothetical protein
MQARYRSPGDSGVTRLAGRRPTCGSSSRGDEVRVQQHPDLAAQKLK